jgi:hypothetical protein
MNKNDKEYYDQWKCKTCGKMYVVPDLARQCEQKHAKSRN